MSTFIQFNVLLFLFSSKIVISSTYDDIPVTQIDQNQLISSRFGFNVNLSETLPTNRTVPDTRHKTCPPISTYPSHTEKISVIIVFYDEPHSTLLRTVLSVINRTPSDNLFEIILLHDDSDVDSKYEIEFFRNIHVDIRNILHYHTSGERLGLIRARILAASFSSGDILIFLDSHCECNVGWSEPLVHRILISSQPTVVTPVIDIIDRETLRYKPSPLMRGGFDWSLNFRWEPLTRKNLPSEHHFSQPFDTPVLAGGLFAVRKQYFHHLGDFDRDLLVWGGENLELSFRVWMCGGRVEIHPCSRVGHVYKSRGDLQLSDGLTNLVTENGVTHHTVLRNSLRVAKVWMDDYVENFLSAQPDAMVIEFGSIKDRLELKRRLGCKSFRWYLENVYPDHPKLLTTTPNTESLQNKTFSIQPSSYPELAFTSNLTISNVNPVKSNYFWIFDNQKLRNVGNVQCLTISERQTLYLGECSDVTDKNDEAQMWNFVKSNELFAIFNMKFGLCLSYDEERIETIVPLKKCNESDTSVLWNIIHTDINFISVDQSSNVRTEL